MTELPGWMVTATHVDTRSQDGRAPWGVRHARRSGEHRTACGLPAHGWPLFWHLAFDGRSGLECRECVYSVLGGSRTPTPV